MTRNCHLVVLELLLMVAALCGPSSSIAAAAEDKPDCSAQVVQLAPCLSFVSGQDTQPPETCCDALAAVLVQTPTCVCELIAGGANASANTGLPTINLTLVKLLPKTCGVQEQAKIDESRCPGHGNHTLAPPSGPQVISPPGSKSGSVMLVLAPSFRKTSFRAILIFAAGRFYEHINSSITSLHRVSVT